MRGLLVALVTLSCCRPSRLPVVFCITLSLPLDINAVFDSEGYRRTGAVVWPDLWGDRYIALPARAPLNTSPLTFSRSQLSHEPPLVRYNTCAQVPFEGLGRTEAPRRQRVPHPRAVGGALRRARMGKRPRKSPGK